jgi:citrate lyase beta subunit
LRRQHDFSSANPSATEKLKYSIGALLYVPALNGKITGELCEKKYPCLSSIAFCFEDAILDESLADAEKVFLASMERLSNFITKTPDQATNLPNIFIRVRSPEHFHHICRLIQPFNTLITGAVLPKYDAACAEAYEKELLAYNAARERPFFVMPILESACILYKENRTGTLIELKRRLDAVSPYILNIRVGGSDFCNVFGLRRKVTQTIYDISVVRDALGDILNIFSRDYVVSGPVWEYFGSNAESKLWQEGLEREMELDKLNGFIGKTSIHPSQLPVIVKAMRVNSCDYEDALQLVNWREKSLGVLKSASHSPRMNEVKAHTKWARKILLLAELYGIAYD